MLKDPNLEPRELRDEESLAHLVNNPGPVTCDVVAIQSARGASREVVDLLLDGLCDNDIRAGEILDANGHPIGDGAGITIPTTMPPTKAYKTPDTFADLHLDLGLENVITDPGLTHTRFSTNSLPPHLGK